MNSPDMTDSFDFGTSDLEFVSRPARPGPVGSYRHTKNLARWKEDGLMIDRQQLLKDLQRLLPKLEKDILAYCNQNEERSQHLVRRIQKRRKPVTSEHFCRMAKLRNHAKPPSPGYPLAASFAFEDNGLLAEPVLSARCSALAAANPKHAKDRIAYFNQHWTHAGA